MRRTALLISLLLVCSGTLKAMNTDLLVASRKSNKYHLESCIHAKMIKKENKIYFSTPKEARDIGYIPCKVCKPPTGD